MNTVLVDYMGFRIVVRPTDEEHNHFFVSNRVYEPHVTEHFKAMVPGKRVLDIGANVGYYTLLALHCGASWAVAVEPTYYLVDMLKNSLKANPGFFEKALQIRGAASDRFGKATRFNQLDTITSNGELHVEGNTTVSTHCLGAYAEAIGKIDVIKIDVEGHEERAMQGMPGILANNPAIFTEFYPRLLRFQGSTPEDYLKRLFDNRSVWVLDKWTHKKVRCETPKDVMAKYEFACQTEGEHLAYLDLLSVYG
jgi:FkbM family methyltransferase